MTMVRRIWASAKLGWFATALCMLTRFSCDGLSAASRAAVPACGSATGTCQKACSTEAGQRDGLTLSRWAAPSHDDLPRRRRSEDIEKSQRLQPSVFGNVGTWPSESPEVAELFKVLWEYRAILKDPPDALAERVQSLLDCLQASDLELQPSDAMRLRRSTGVGYQEIYCGPDMTLCAFVLRAGARIPLHDHPSMNVFGRLLFGRLRVISYDIASSRYVAEEARHNAELDRQLPEGAVWVHSRTEEVLGPEAETFVLEPMHRNIHEFEALEDCAFFDVVAPPYDPAKGRDCTYYQISSSHEVGGRNGEPASELHFLTPTRYASFSTQSLTYKGPSFSAVTTQETRRRRLPPDVSMPKQRPAAERAASKRDLSQTHLADLDALAKQFNSMEKRVTDLERSMQHSHGE
eukprot:TRINITY_DN45781_c0_g2_i2.p1 TRINITY_DN45781_c0_g2~~TRINITY_DN45781_c0_g2_i2.p1  ORF type:complete len:406 (-),score=60.42 TRINITY_DN45781_c0_g2_i2:381-1598(-)